MEEDGGEGGRNVHGEGRIGLSKSIGGLARLGVAAFVHMAVLGDICKAQMTADMRRCVNIDLVLIYANQKSLF